MAFAYISAMCAKLAGRVSLAVVRVLSRIVVVYNDASVSRDNIVRTSTSTGSLSGTAIVPPAGELFKSVDAAACEYAAGQVMALSAANPFFPSMRGIVQTYPVNRADNDAAMYSHLVETTITELVMFGFIPFIFGSDGDHAQRQQQRSTAAHSGLCDVIDRVARGAAAGAPSAADMPAHRRVSTTLYQQVQDRLQARLEQDDAPEIVGADGATASDSESLSADDALAAAALLALSDEEEDESDDDASSLGSAAACDDAAAAAGDDVDADSSADCTGDDGGVGALPPPVQEAVADDASTLLQLLGISVAEPTRFRYLGLSDPTHVAKLVHESFGKPWALFPPTHGLTGEANWRAECVISLAVYTALVRTSASRAYEPNEGVNRSGISTCVPWLSAALIKATVVPATSFGSMRVGLAVVLFSQLMSATLAENALLDDATLRAHAGTARFAMLMAAIVTFWHTTEGISAAEWHSFWRAKIQEALELFSSAIDAWAKSAASKEQGDALPVGVNKPPRGLLVALEQLCRETIVAFDVLFEICEQANKDSPPADGEEEFEARIVPMVATQNRLERFFGSMRGGRGGEPISHWASSQHASAINRLLKYVHVYNEHKSRAGAQNVALRRHIASIFKAARLIDFDLTDEQKASIENM